MRFFKSASKTQYKGREKPRHLEGARPKRRLGGHDVSTKKVFKKTTYEVPETKLFKSLNVGLLEKIHW